MTQQRRDNHSTEFGLWLRKQEKIDSRKYGFVTTNIDYVWKNYRTGKYMFIEEKRYMSDVRFYQKNIFNEIDRACKNDENYCGFYVLKFEKTNPNDGKIYLNDIEITKEDLFKFLQFDFDYIFQST